MQRFIHHSFSLTFSLQAKRQQLQQALCDHKPEGQLHTSPHRSGSCSKWWTKRFLYISEYGDIWVDEFKSQFFFHQAYVLHPFESTQKRFSFSEGTMTLWRECDAFAAVSFRSLLLPLSALFLARSFVQGVHFAFSWGYDFPKGWLAIDKLNPLSLFISLF